MWVSGLWPSWVILFNELHIYALLLFWQKKGAHDMEWYDKYSIDCSGENWKKGEMETKSDSLTG